MMKKLSPNEKCHCGSNKKYKKCCSAADEAARFERDVYKESEMLQESIEILHQHFPDMTFKNVSEKLNSKSYKPLQIQNFSNGASCMVAERCQINEKVFKERDTNDDEYDLLLMYKGAYRILHGGANVKCYTNSLKSFFTNPAKEAFATNTGEINIGCNWDRDVADKS